MINGNRSLKRFSIFLTLCFCINTASQAYETERVVLVIVDGLRYSEGLGDPEHTYTPRMAELADQGALVADFQNDGFTYTSRAVPAIWTGAWTTMNSFSDSTCDGSSNSYSSQPSLFEYYRKGLNQPESDCVYSLLDLCSWKGSFHPEYGPEYWPLYHTAGNTDEEVWHETEQIISGQAPHLLLMYLADVAHGGHSGNWNEYTQSISIADSLIGELWETLQADPVYAGVTTLLVTNDHGRHDYNFAGHGDGCVGCRQIQLLAIGPDIPPGLVSTTARTIPDITPTIGALLGFPTEYATGNPMLELLNDPNSLSPVVILPGYQLKAFPNPMNAGLTIHFKLDSNSDVQLRIFDLQGRLVQRLFSGVLGQGPYQFLWDGMDLRGQTVSSGTYLLALETPQSSALVKLLVLK